MNKVAVLAGGSGSRLGGLDKGMVRIDGLTLVEWLMEALKGLDTVIVCRDKEAQDYYSIYSSVVEDEFKEMGPLAGIHAALRYFKESVLVVGVDMPFVRRGVVDCLLREFSHEEEEALIPSWNGKNEPLLACYNYMIVDKVEESLRGGEKKIINALNMDQVNLYPVDKLRQYDEDLVSFLNINTYKDLDKVEELCSQIDLGGKLPT